MNRKQNEDKNYPVTLVKQKSNLNPAVKILMSQNELLGDKSGYNDVSSVVFNI